MILHTLYITWIISHSEKIEIFLSRLKIHTHRRRYLYLEKYDSEIHEINIKYNGVYLFSQRDNYKIHKKLNLNLIDHNNMYSMFSRKIFYMR